MMDESEQHPERTAGPGSRVSGFCADCPFFDLISGVHPPTGEQVPPTWGGLCRFDAPRHVLQTDELPGPGAGISVPRPGQFPMVGVRDWCGRHPLRVAAYEEALKDLRQAMNEVARENRHTKRALMREGVRNLDPRANAGRLDR